VWWWLVVGSEGKPHPRLVFASEEGGEVHRAGGSWWVYSFLNGKHEDRKKRLRRVSTLEPLLLLPFLLLPFLLLLLLLLLFRCVEVVTWPFVIIAVCSSCACSLIVKKNVSRKKKCYASKKKKPAPAVVAVAAIFRCVEVC
jgi:hypothetical protein